MNLFDQNNEFKKYFFSRSTQSFGTLKINNLDKLILITFY